MRALLFGTDPEPVPEPETDNPLLAALAKTPMRLVDLDDPRFLLPDWVVTAPRLTGICGSDAKQVFFDWGEMSADNPMVDFTTFPQVLGHEVVAEVVELGPEAEGLDVGDRVVLNPWLSCGPRCVSPVCPACAVGDLSLCWNFTEGPISAGIHTGTSKDASGGWATRMPAHDSMLFKVPDSIPDEIAVFADPFVVSLHSVTRNPPPPGGRVLVYGAGALGTCAVTILRALYPEVEVSVVARFGAQADLARRLGAHAVFAHAPVRGLIEEAAAWSGGVLHGHHDLPMAYPGGIDVVYDTVSRKETLEVSVRLLKARGTLVKAGVHGPTSWEWTPLFFKEISWVGSNAFGFEEVDGERRHGIQHYLDLVEAGRVDLTGMLTHTFALDDWRAAFTVLATQDSSDAIKVALTSGNELSLRVTGSEDAEGLALLARRASSAASDRDPGAVVHSVAPLSGGYSSLTYTATLAGSEPPDVAIVLKIAPVGVMPIKNRDMLRQVRVLRCLAGVPEICVPEVLFESAGDPPDAPPFFATRFVDGDSVEPLVDPIDDPSAEVLAARALAAVRMLGVLHRITPASVGLGDEPETSLVAEVEHWRRSFESVEEDLRFGGVELGDRLLESAPDPLAAGIVHGDYKLGNIRGRGATIRAIVDWEIWSVGDGRIDLAWFLLMLDKDYPMRLHDVPELPSASELHAKYERSRGVEVRDLEWFHAFVRFKQAAATALLTKQARKRGGEGYPATITTLLAAAQARIDA